MDLFVIICTTCKSRLRVRDPAAVGQILACPKCGGMVMIKPPPAWNEAGEEKSDLPTAPDVEGPRVRFDQTAHGSAFDLLEELLSDAPPKVQSPQPPASPSVPAAGAASVANGPPAAAKPRFVGGPPVKRSSTPPSGTPKPNVTPPSAGPIPPATKSTQSTAVAGSVGAVSSPARQPVMPSEVKISVSPPGNSAATPVAKPPSAARPRKPWLLMTGSVAVGILLAFTAVTAAIHFLRPADVGRPIAPRPAAKNTRPADPVDATSPTIDTPSQASVATSEPAQPTTPDVPAEAAATAPAPLPTTTTPTDPLGLVKSDASPAATTPVASTDPLAKFDRILGGGADDPLGKSVAKTPQTPATPPADAGPARPIAPRPPPREIDVARRLADPLSGIETAPSGTALADFLQLMSDLSTIPITLDVPFVPITPESAVSLRMTNTTVGNALAEALRPLRLEYVMVDDQLVVRRAEPSAPRPVTVSVKDLTGGDEPQLADLTDLLKAVVEPTAWGEGEGLGTITADAAKSSLTISHPGSIRFPIQVRLVIEKLREAHKPPLAHELKLDPIFFKLDTRTSLAKPRLEKLVSLNYSQPARLLTILERLGSLTGMRMLVDWRDVASAGWNPAGDATLLVRNEPLSAALDSLLTPLDLTWRVIDGQTVQVITPARLAEQGELEFYKIDDLLTGGQTSDELIAKVRAALGDTAFISSGGIGEIRFDDSTKCLLAWLSQPKQRELESLLAKWRSKS